jgi:hypothetical protein
MTVKAVDVDAEGSPDLDSALYPLTSSMSVSNTLGGDQVLDFEWNVFEVCNAP